MNRITLADIPGDEDTVEYKRPEWEELQAFGPALVSHAILACHESKEKAKQELNPVYLCARMDNHNTVALCMDCIYKIIDMLGPILATDREQAGFIAPCHRCGHIDRNRLKEIQVCHYGIRKE